MRPTQTPPGGARLLRDHEAPDFLEAHAVALLAFLDLQDPLSQRMRQRVEMVAAKWTGTAAGPAHGLPAAGDRRGHFGAGVVDVSRDRLVAEAMGVTSVPTVVLFADGALVDRLMGAAPESVLDEMVKTRVRGVSGSG